MIETPSMSSSEYNPKASIMIETPLKAEEIASSVSLYASSSLSHMKSIPSNESLETLTTDSSDSSSDVEDSISRLSIDESNDSDEPQPSQIHRASKLSWGTVQIREYNRTIGDHPEVAYGPPLSLDWDYAELEPKDLDDYEENRKPKKRFLRMTSLTRRNLLHNVFDIPEQELLDAEKRAQKNQKKRQQSNRQGYFAARAEDRLRKIKRRFSKEVIFNALSAASGPFMGMNSMSMSIGSPLQV